MGGVEMDRRLYIINPAGNGGAGVRVWEQFKELWNHPLDENDIIFTKRPGHAIEIASTAEGYTTLVSVGGDGTVNEVMEGIMKNRSGPSLAMIPAGTGNDVGRNVGITSLHRAVSALKDNHRGKYDVLKVDYGRDVKYSFLTTNFGFSANHRVIPWMKRRFGPAIAYYFSTFLEILLFRPWNMTIEWDTGKYSGNTTIALFANVERSSGGSMVVGPGASPVDGKITGTIVPFKSKLDCLFVKFPKTPKGTIIEEPDVQYFQTETVRILSTPPTDMDIDGDIFGRTPATVTVCPKAIRVVCPVKDGK
jgi:YegS/Rv2252/BmrU family lipid kinase